MTLTHRQNARTSWAVSMTSEHDSSSIATDVARRSDAARRSDRARPRSDHRRAERHAERARLRLPALDGRQPAERAPRLPACVSRRAGGPAPAGHVQLLRAVGRRPALPADRRSRRRRQPAAARQHPAGRQRPDATCRSRRSISSAARPACAAGAATKSARSAGRAADRRQQHARVQRGAARDAARQARRRAVPRRRQRLGRLAGRSTSAICATRSARACATRRRSARSASTSAISSIRFPACSSTATPQTAPLAHSLQHRPGVLMAEWLMADG